MRMLLALVIVALTSASVMAQEIGPIEPMDVKPALAELGKSG